MGQNVRLCPNNERTRFCHSFSLCLVTVGEGVKLDTELNLQRRDILLTIPAEKAELLAFLERHHLHPEDDLTYATALVNDEDEIVACGASNGRLLKCFAVDEDLRGCNALGRLVNDLTTYCMQQGCFNPMVVTRAHNVPLFQGCGFACVAQTEQVGLLERIPGGAARFAGAFRQPEDAGKTIGAIVMNANPFTRGHRFLAEQAAAQCDVLHIFVVEEDRSAFPFAHRLELVKQGTADLANVRVHPGGPYIISDATFPRYFLKETDDAAVMQTELDAQVFANAIAPALNITRRFVGTEPNCGLTDQYNRSMQAVLPKHGIELVEIPRIQSGEQAISASRVRAILAESGITAELAGLLPPTTLSYLESPDGQDIIAKLQAK